MRRIILLGVLALGAGLAACNSNSNVNVPTLSNGAYVRFLQGSPDNSGVDLQMDGSVIISGVGGVNGGLTGALSPYVLILPGSHTFQAVVTGTSTTIGSSVSYTVPTPRPTTSAGSSLTILSRTTFVLGGGQSTSAPNAVTLYTFPEPTFTTNGSNGSAVVVYANAAPDDSSSAQPISFGIIPVTPGSPPSPVPSAMPLAGTTASLAPGVMSSPLSAASQGAVAAIATLSGGTQAVVFPSALDQNDAGDFLPYDPNDTNLSVFAIDGPVGSPGSIRLVGVFDPNN